MTARVSRWAWATAAAVAAVTLGVQVLRWSELGPWSPVEIRTFADGSRFEVPPADCAALTRYFESQAGEGIDVVLVRAAAQASRLALEERMDRLAATIDPSADDWRTVFARLSQEAPTTVEEVLAAYREEVGRAEQFVRERDLVQVPAAPIRVVEVTNSLFEDSFPLAMYVNGGTLGVITRADRDPGYLANQCWVCIPPLAVHEGVPGHHVAFSLGVPQGRDLPTEINLIVQEGWAVYAELLMGEQGYWAERPADELAALRMIYWRATRALVDSELHCGSLDRERAEVLYQTDLGMTAEAATTELTRHLLSPGSKSSYFVGASQIRRLRKLVLATAPETPGALRSFHDRLLRQPGPLPAVARETFGIELPPFAADDVLLWGES